jgi:hypothetical protein
MFIFNYQTAGRRAITSEEVPEPGYITVCVIVRMITSELKCTILTILYFTGAENTISHRRLATPPPTVGPTPSWNPSIARAHCWPSTTPNPNPNSPPTASPDRTVDQRCGSATTSHRPPNHCAPPPGRFTLLSSSSIRSFNKKSRPGFSYARSDNDRWCTSYCAQSVVLQSFRIQIT